MKKNGRSKNTTKAISQQIIFLLCVLTLFGLPLLKEPPFFLTRILLSLIVAFALLTLDKMSNKFILVAVLVIVIEWIARVSSNLLLEYVSEFTMNVFLFWMVGSNVQRIMLIKEVFLHNIFEAVNGFFLLAIAFTNFAFFLQYHYPQSFSSMHSLAFGTDLIYYTIITLTTTGYGDVVPQTPAAKDLATIMAISGQFYVTVIMAIMVGKYANQNK